MRGKGIRQREDWTTRRITPAYAGKRLHRVYLRGCYQDHPRVCGEKFAIGFLTQKHLGSPPRMRGKVCGHGQGTAPPGITPAYAGKSSFLSGWTLTPRDHPRVCGEKVEYVVCTGLVQGSPPRMRGKAVSSRSVKFTFRITPAYAGKRLKRSRSTVPPVAIVPLFPSVCNKPVVSDGSPAGRDAPLFLPVENAVPASPAYNLRSL